MIIMHLKLISHYQDLTIESGTKIFTTQEPLKYVKTSTVSQTCLEKHALDTTTPIQEIAATMMTQEMDSLRQHYAAHVEEVTRQMAQDFKTK